MPEYIRTEWLAVRLVIRADSPEDAEDIGNDYFDALLFDDTPLRKRAKVLDNPECKFLDAESTGDSEVEEKK